MIHPTAIVSPKAEIGKNVEIGPYTVIEDDVRIGDDCYIDAHVKIGQYTTIGPRCSIYYGAFIGEPQDHRFYKGIQSYVEIGSDTVIREYVNIHRPPFEFLKTVIGSHVTLYQGVTLGARNFSYGEDGKPLNLPRHPILEDGVTVYSNASILGRVTIGRDSVIGGNVWFTRSVPEKSRILQGKTQDFTFTDGAGI